MTIFLLKYVKWKWILLQHVTDQSSSLLSIFQLFMGLWVLGRHRNKSSFSESNPVQSSRSYLTICPIKERESVKSRLQMAEQKSWETISFMILNQSLQPKLLQLKSCTWKPHIDLKWQRLPLSKMVLKAQALSCIRIGHQYACGLHGHKNICAGNSPII